MAVDVVDGMMRRAVTRRRQEGKLNGISMSLSLMQYVESYDWDGCSRVCFALRDRHHFMASDDRAPNWPKTFTESSRFLVDQMVLLSREKTFCCLLCDFSVKLIAWALDFLRKGYRFFADKVYNITKKIAATLL